MSVYYSDDLVTLHHGDCLDVLRTLPDASVDAVVTDPPYGLSNTDPAHVSDTVVRWVNGERDYLPPVKGGFMGQEWDSFVPPVAVWDECYRVLKPGGHVLAFAGSRTHDLMTLSIRLAGFDIRDSIAWLYGSGFPKSLDVSKAIDKAAGAEREVVGSKVGLPGYSLASSKGTGHLKFGGFGGDGDPEREAQITAPATPDAERWQGWGTALKPAFEPIVVARKPLAGTVAANVLEHGTGALNIAACRVGDEVLPEQRAGAARIGTFERTDMVTSERVGRWPTNVVLDDTQAAELDRQSGERTSAKPSTSGRYGEHEDTGRNETYGKGLSSSTPNRAPIGDTGGASRFFPTFRYEAKAPTSERPKVNGVAHNTVKPLALMRWLVRLVTPPGGTVLEPFAGSGTTVEACVIEGFRCIAIEKTEEYLPLTVARIHRQRNPVEAIRQAGDDLGLFEGLEGMGA